MPSGSRQNIYEKNGLHIIADCYNASPESMTAALSVLRGFPGRRIAVLGDMLELGAYAGRLHRDMGAAVCGAADRFSQSAARQSKSPRGPAARGMPRERIRVFPADGHEAAAQALREIVRPGDSLLFKASNRMNLKKVIERMGIS